MEASASPSSTQPLPSLSWSPPGRTFVMVFPVERKHCQTDISVDEANDELDLPSEGVFHRLMLRFFPKERPWSGSAEMTSDIKRFNVPINDFFDGNSGGF